MGTTATASRFEPGTWQLEFMVLSTEPQQLLLTGEITENITLKYFVKLKKVSYIEFEMECWKPREEDA